MQANKDAERKYLRTATSENTSARLIMFPPAGGSAVIYQPWLKLMPDWLDAASYQMPGHGSRMGQPLCESVDELVDDIVDSIHMVHGKPLYLFGHSLGGRVAYALCRRMLNDGLELPRLVFVSASKAPDVKPRQRLSRLSDTDFVESLQQYGGIPDELLKNPDAMAFFLPSMRKDMMIFESYLCQSTEQIPTSVINWGGKEDTFSTLSDIVGWNRFFALQKEFRSWPGGHFYINENREEMVNRIVESIELQQRAHNTETDADIAVFQHMSEGSDRHIVGRKNDIG